MVNVSRIIICIEYRGFLGTNEIFDTQLLFEQTLNIHFSKISERIILLLCHHTSSVCLLSLSYYTPPPSPLPPVI